MFQRHRTFKAQLPSGALKRSHRHGIIERIVQPAQLNRLRRNSETGADQPKIVAFSRPEHHAMLSQTNRLRIAVHRRVANGKKCHYDTPSAISSVQTLKLSRKFGPNEVTMATSDASRPRAINTRPM